MIVHIFTARRYHLVPNISKRFIVDNQNYSHKYILFGDNNLDETKYVNLYKEYNFKSYVFVHNLWEFIKVIVKYKKSALLFHDGEYIWFLICILLGCKNINWVCWGGGASIGKSLSSKVVTPVKKYIYNSFNNIFTLMDQDMITINRDFKIPLKKMQVVSYSGKSEYDDLYMNLLNSFKQNDSKPIVLVGNNPGNINYYIKILDLLYQYKGKIKIQFMMHYSLKRDDKYMEFINKGMKMYGNDFRSNEEFYSFKDYIHYMNKCSIYICGSVNQTGLGAISTCMLLGKKIYIAGKNYEWIREKYGAKIFHYNTINPSLSYESFMEGLSFEDKISNHNAIINNRASSKNKWNEVFELLDRILL